MVEYLPSMCKALGSNPSIGWWGSDIRSVKNKMTPLYSVLKNYMSEGRASCKQFTRKIIKWRNTRNRLKIHLKSRIHKTRQTNDYTR